MENESFERISAKSAIGVQLNQPTLNWADADSEIKGGKLCSKN